MQEDSDDNNIDDVQRGQALGLTIGQQYDVWIRAAVGEGDQALYGEPSDASVGGVPVTSDDPELWCTDPAELLKENHIKILYPVGLCPDEDANLPAA